MAMVLAGQFILLLQGAQGFTGLHLCYTTLGPELRWRWSVRAAFPFFNTEINFHEAKACVFYLAWKIHTLSPWRSSGWLDDRLVRKRLVFWRVYAEVQKEIQGYFSLGFKPPGVSVTSQWPDGHAGWEEGAHHSESFIPMPGIWIVISLRGSRREHQAS